MQFSRLRVSLRQASSQASRQHPQQLLQLPLQQDGHALAARQATQASSAATAVSLSRLLQQQAGHALVVRQATQVSSAATAVSLSRQQLLQLALSAAGSLQMAICLSSALSAAQRLNKIRNDSYINPDSEAVSRRDSLFVYFEIIYFNRYAEY